jgi:hypothetical protein
MGHDGHQQRIAVAKEAAADEEDDSWKKQLLDGKSEHLRHSVFTFLV